MNKALKLNLIANYGANVALGIFTPIYALFVLKVGGNAVDAGISVGIYLIGGGLLMLALRKFEDRAKWRKELLVGGYILEALAAAYLLWVHSVWQLYLAQFVHAIATSLRVPAQRAAYSQQEDRGREGSEWSLMEGGDFIIQGLSAILGGVIVTIVNFQAVFAVMAGVMLVSAVLARRSFTAV